MMISAKELFRSKQRIIIFGIIGGMNTLVDYTMYSIFLTVSSWGLGTCQTIGYVAGVINSFIMNRWITFRDGSATRIEIQVPRFVLVNIFTLVISILCLKLFVNTLGLNPYLAKIPVTIAVMILNYFGYKKYVFRVKATAED